VSLANDLLKKFEPEIGNLTLIPSDSGRFEVQVNDTLLYSKLQTGRHPEPGEVAGLLEKFTKK
jgi:selenoprotein W-related protein